MAVSGHQRPPDTEKTLHFWRVLDLELFCRPDLGHLPAAVGQSL